MAVLEVEAAALKPLVKWAGGKRWQVPHIARLWAGHEHRRLIEPFCGGMAITLGLMPERAVLNDVNTHLINLYRQVQRGWVETFAGGNSDSDYYMARTRFNDRIRAGMADTPEAAGLFYYLNRTGFNGLCRFNSRGEYNVPFGKFKTINYQDDFSAFREVFARWQFMCADVAHVPIVPTDFIYADPPYDVEFTTYSQGGFSWADQERTAALLAQHPGPVVLVNQATSRIEALYRGLGFTVSFLDAPRRISCTGDRTPAREIMATRNLGE
jgi:DNA adenine methylase